MEFRILTDLPSAGSLRLDLTSHVLLMGSCFAQGVGERLTDALPDGHVLINPFGTIFNPLSICRCLDLLIDDAASPEPYLFHGHDGLWHSWLHATRFSAPTHEECFEKVQQELISARAFLRHTDVLCLTWGTSYVFELVEEQTEEQVNKQCNALLRGVGLQAAEPLRIGSDHWSNIVSNCHKEPSKCFVRRRATIDDITAATVQLIHRLRTLRPALQVLLTVSPYRYARSGLHQSTLSKSTLHLASEQVVTLLDGVIYFPAYEIVIDELRDYRFYEADMLHSSALATDYVWERFRSWSFTSELEQFTVEKLKRLRTERHRPLFMLKSELTTHPREQSTEP